MGLRPGEYGATVQSDSLPAPEVNDTCLWSEQDELHRVGMIAAGIEPRLRRCWVSSPTGQLQASLAEYSRPDSGLGLHDVIADLRVELAYRGAA